MSSEHRVAKLRELLARLERMPASPDTERMLREVRARVVDVDTGVTPQAMRPVEALPLPEPPATRAPKAATGTRADHKVSPPKQPVPATPKAPAVTKTGLTAAEDREWLALVTRNEVLSLDGSEPLPPADGSRAADDLRPWRRGLRG